MKWLRLWTEWAHDPKIISMPEHMRCRHVTLLCLRRQVDTSTLTDEEIASYMRISMDDLLETKELFQRKNFIDNGWNVLAWNFRNPPSDSSADRTRKYRERQKKKESDKSETSQERHGDARDTDTDTDTDTEKEIKTLCSNSDAIELATLLRDRILGTKPNFKEPTAYILNEWAKSIDYMIRIDNRDPPKIKETINWLFSENLVADVSFVVYSGKALRKKFDSIETQMKKGERYL